MARTSTYLNFMGDTEEAFTFYKNVFGSEFQDQIQYIRDVPADPTMPKFTDAELNMVMHVELPITGGHILMGTDALESMGQSLTFGNNVSINVEPDSKEETKRLFTALSTGGSEVIELSEMFWGGYFGTFRDKYGVRWMFNCADS